MSPRKRRDRGQEILHIARQIATAGTVTMEAVARAAGMGKATLYRHYPSLQALHQALAAGGGVAPPPPEAASDRGEAILRAALRVYTRSGLNGTTMEAVAREAHLSPGSIYRVFAGKDDMLEQLMGQFAALGDDARGLEGAVNDREALIAFAQNLLETAVERAPLLRLVVATPVDPPDTAVKSFRQGFTRITAALAAFLDERVQRGAFRPGHNFLRAQAFVSACLMYGLVVQVPGAVASIPREMVAREYADAFYQGMRR